MVDTKEHMDTHRALVAKHLQKVCECLILFVIKISIVFSVTAALVVVPATQRPRFMLLRRCVYFQNGCRSDTSGCFSYTPIFSLFLHLLGTRIRHQPLPHCKASLHSVRCHSGRGGTKHRVIILSPHHLTFLFFSNFVYYKRKNSSAFYSLLKLDPL